MVQFFALSMLLWLYDGCFRMVRIEMVGSGSNEPWVGRHLVVGGLDYVAFLF